MATASSFQGISSKHKTSALWGHFGLFTFDIEIITVTFKILSGRLFKNHRWQLLHIFRRGQHYQWLYCTCAFHIKNTVTLHVLSPGCIYRNYTFSEHIILTWDLCTMTFWPSSLKLRPLTLKSSSQYSGSAQLRGILSINIIYIFLNVGGGGGGLDFVNLWKEVPRFHWQKLKGLHPSPH